MSDQIRTWFNTNPRLVAWQFLKDNRITRLPVNPFEIARRLGVIVMNYDDFAAHYQVSTDYLVGEISPDGFARFVDKYFIVAYNNNVASLGRKRWTITHELAHFILGHISLAVPLLGREHKKAKLDMAADAFTRRVLCPSIVLESVGVETPDQIAALCGISYLAAKNVHLYMSRLRQNKKFGTIPLELEVLKQFQPFIDQTLKKG